MQETRPVVGALVRSLRHTAGLSQAELAEAAGLSERSISDLERGLRLRIYPATARRLATVLGLTGDELASFLRAATASDAKSRAAEEVPSVLRSRFPTLLGTFVGRRRECSLLRELLGASEARLITIVGPAGVGKTRLANEVARLTSETFGDARFFVDLSPAESAEDVLQVIATAVGAPASDIRDGLIARLNEARTLLVLDTMEHLLDAAPDLSYLLGGCPSLSVLVTSREPLNIRDERLVQIDPLEDRSDDGEPAPAVQLFLDRSRHAGAEIAGTPEVIELVQSICRRLDCLPLAIELAAARTPHTALGDLLVSLDQKLQVLEGGARDAQPRHRTMRAALDWSYELLDDAHQRQLRALSVFRGGFDLDAAAWLDGPGWSDHRTRLLGRLGRLVEANLVGLDHDQFGQGRYRMLGVVIDYARERAVQVGETAALQRAHADFYRRLAQQAEPHLRGLGQREWHARLLADEGNLRAATIWTLEHGEADHAVDLAASLWMFWRWAGMFREGRTWLLAALNREGTTPVLRLRALWGSGWLAYHQGNYAETQATGREILATAATDDAINRRNGLTLISIAVLADGDIGRAVTTATEALELAESVDVPWLQATSLLNIGTALLASGDVTAAERHYERSLEMYRTLGDEHFMARVLIQLGFCALAGGDRRNAATLIGEAAAITVEVGDLWGIAEGLEAVAAVVAEREAEHAAVLLGGANEIRNHISMNPQPADARILERHMEAARRELGSEPYRAATRRGATMAITELEELARDAVGRAAQDSNLRRRD